MDKKFKCRFTIAVDNEQDYTYHHLLASRYLQGVASVFSLTLHPMRVVILPLEEEGQDISYHKFLVYELECQKRNRGYPKLLAGVGAYLMFSSSFLDVGYEKFPYRMNF